MVIKATITSATVISISWSLGGMNVPTSIGNGPFGYRLISSVAKYSSVFPQTCTSTYCQCIANKYYNPSTDNYPDYSTRGYSVESDESNFLSLGQMSRDKWTYYTTTENTIDLLMDFSYVSWATLNKGYRICSTRIYFCQEFTRTGCHH